MNKYLLYGIGILLQLGIVAAVGEGSCVPSINLQNLTIPTACTSDATLQIKINTSFTGQGTPVMNYYCYNGTSWYWFAYAGTDCSGGTGTNQLFEESIFYNSLTNNKTVTTSNTSLSTVLADGKYYYGLTIYDQAGNSKYYDPNITIDTTPPSIYFSNNTPANNTTITILPYFTSNVTVNDTMYLNYTVLYLYNATGDLINTTYNTTATYTGLSDGTYYINATAYDLAGNSNSTETRTIILDYYADNITLSGYEKISNMTIPFDAYFLTQQDTYNYIVNDGAQVFSNPDSAFDGNTGTSALASNSATNHDAQLGKIFNQSTYVRNIYYNVQGTSNDGGTNTLNIYLETYDNSTWNTISTLYTISTGSTINSGIVAGTYDLNASTYGVRVRFVGMSSVSAVTKNSYLYELQLNTSDYNSKITYNYSVTNRSLIINNISKGNITYTILFNTTYGLGGYNTCTYNWTATDNYVFPECIFYNHKLNITAYNSYTGLAINTFNTTLTENTTTYNESQNTTNGIINYNIIQGLDYGITLNPYAHLSSNTIYAAATPTGTLNLSANQSIITLNFIHAFTQQLINNANITLNDTSYTGKIFNTSNGTIIFNPNAGTHNLRITSQRYTIRTYNLTVTDQDIRTVNITLYPILNLTIYDEKLSGINLTYFDFSKPTQMKYTAYCSSNNTETTVQHIISNTTPPGPYLLNTTCPITKLRFDLIYSGIDGTTAYHRIIVPSATILDFDFKVFIPDLSLPTSILQTFLKPNDILGKYTVETGTLIRVTKLMPTGTEVMLADYMDAEGKITAYLIQGDSYILTVLAEGVPAKIIGPYNADSAGTKTLRLYDVGLIDPTLIGSTPTHTSLTDVQFYNLTANQSLLMMSYRDGGEFTNQLIMTIYNGSCNYKKNILMQSILERPDLILTNFSAEGSYNIFGSRYQNGSSNQIFCSAWNVTYSGGLTAYREETMVYDSWIPRPGTFTNPWTFPWIVMLILTTIALGLNARTVSLGSIVIMVLAGIMFTWNWVQAGTPGVTTFVVFGLALLIAIGLAFKRNVI